MHLRARIFIDNTLGGGDGGAKILHLILIISSRSQDRRGLCESIYGRMDRHGGRAVVHSSPGAGTEVELVIER